MDAYSNINMNQNQILNLVLQNTTTAPTTPVKGQLYYDSTANIFYFYNGTKWVDVLDGVMSMTGTTGIIVDNTNPKTPIVKLSYDDSTIGLDANGKAIVKTGGITATQLASNAVSTIKLLNSNVTFQKIQDIPTMTVLGRVATGTGVASAIEILNDATFATANATSLATSGSIKSYVDGRIASIGMLIDGFDASTATGFPTNPEKVTVKSDYWYVTKDGTVLGVPLTVGDVLIANKNAPSTSNPNDWIILESNRDKATTEVYGYVKIATSAEVLAGTGSGVVTAELLEQKTASETRKGIVQKASDSEMVASTTENTKYVTPKQVMTIINAGIGTYKGNIGNGTITSFAISHGLNSDSVLCDVFDSTTKQKVIVDIAITSTSVVTINFTKAPKLNQFYVIIQK